MKLWAKGIVAGLVVASVTTFTIYGMTTGRDLAASGQEELFDLVSPMYEDLSTTVMVPGSLELVNRQIVQPSSEEGAYEILVETGEDVEEGTPILQYSTTEIDFEIQDIELQMQQSQATITSLTSSEAEINRQKSSPDVQPTYLEDEETGERMEVEPLVSIAELDAQLTELAQQKKAENFTLTRLENQLETAKKQKEERTLTSSINGKVLSINDQGDTTDDFGNSLPLMEIADTTQFTITGNVSERQSMDVELGHVASMYSDSIEDGFWTGEVVDVAYFPAESDEWYGDSAGSQYPVTIQITEGDTEQLRPGYQMMAEIVTSEEMGLTLDMGLVLYDELGSYVFVYEDGVAVRRDVEIDYANDYAVQILEGLTEEDLVIADYMGIVTEGMLITPNEIMEENDEDEGYEDGFEEEYEIEDGELFEDDFIEEDDPELEEQEGDDEL
ncbi:efflux RND transporter periplasmic adaptor subunit [Alkalihalobacillus sp. LMS6]|uniref:efflux RND transporter periplasmic adaptor subunit n=1 Tax=Alkalihalobacillus sp. LMS6 TaxID=2924034 RepID=UPI0020D1B29C|nr:efflux RND transporter periplasmic adaptor subunit [Alkalihalobacillus sp. LMS6]UTR05259.1 efflux RND transporter periplasmic adaptor subunit [Alkalihalobacillus sp. LMS6]